MRVLLSWLKPLFRAASRRPLSRSPLSVALAAALACGSLVWVAGSSASVSDTQLIVRSAEGDLASVRAGRVVIQYENGIGNVVLARNGSWPASVTIHFAPPFDDPFGRFSATRRRDSSNAHAFERLPHRFVETRDGVRYEVDTSTLANDDTLAMSWIDAWRR